MIIKGIAASLPSRIVTNDDMIEMIREQSTEFEGDLEQTLETVKKLLEKSGLQERRWCDRHELPIDHVAMATEKALAASYLQKSHIELLIYVGIGRGFLEPGNSHMIANALGFDKAQCFDIVDACMSWVRAMQLVDTLFKNGGYRNALIINAEFNTHSGGPLYPHNLNLRQREQLAHTFPSFTIGEAATATLLIPNEPDNFEFYFSTRPDLSDLCTIPLKNYEGFCHPTDKIGKNGVMQFTSYGLDLHEKGQSEVQSAFLAMSKTEIIDKVFTHSSSKKEWDQAAKVIGVSDKIHHVYPKTGNLVSASVPTAISDAINNNLLSRGDCSVIWIGSAGMSFNATRFRY
jgi:3-oxoacyl-[acyl-carrier-protein] synthase III